MKFCGYVIEDKFRKRKKMKTERKGRRRRRKKGSTNQQQQQQPVSTYEKRAQDEIMMMDTRQRSCNDDDRSSSRGRIVSQNVVPSCLAATAAAAAATCRSGSGGRRQLLPKKGGSPLSSFVLVGLAITLITDFATKPLGVAIVAVAAAGTGSDEIGEGLTLNQNHRPPSGSSSGHNNLQLPAAGSSSSTPSPQQMEKIKRDSKVSALVGQNVILNCAVQFKDGVEEPFVVNWLKYPNQLPIYIWYAGYPAHVAQGYENRVARIGQASLNLSQVRDSDQGLYLCKINYLDKGPEDRSTEIWNWMFLDVQAPPRFTQTPAPINYVQAGDSLHLTCQAESTPAPILRWYKNKLPIDSDQGPYRLSATTTATATATASAQAPGGPTPGSSDSHRPPEPSLNSSSSSKQMFGAHQISQLDLFIDNVQAGTTTGDYKCLASNSEGSIEARSQVVLALPAVITSMPSEQTALEGEKVELVCQATALPSNITYKWFFMDKPMQTLKWFESRYSIKRDGTLIIYSVHRDDQGLYKCQATNGLSHRLPNIIITTTSPPPASNTKRPSGGSKQHPASATTGSEPATAAPIYAERGTQLHVEYMARITHSPALQYLPMGLPGVIRCYAQASPPAKYYAWTFNDQQFDPDKDQNIERLNNGSLLVRQVNKQYEGKYMCAAFNKHGSAGTSAPMEVRVEEPPRFEARPADFYKATVNGHVKIPCDASGSPKPTISWRRLLGSPSVPTPTLPVTSTTTVSSNSMLLAPNDEAADGEQHFYSNEAHLHDERSTGGSPSVATASDQAEQSESSANGNQQQQQRQQDFDEAQQSVIVNYAKLPSDRSEYKNSYLLLHGLRKDDLGRYECVIENEVATLVASTMLYIEETTPHAPTNLQVETKAWSAHLSWTPSYDGGFEQSFVIWYRQVERPQGAGNSNYPDDQATLRPPNRAPIIMSHHSVKEHHEPLDLNWHSINVQPSDARSFTVQNLSQDTSYEFYVRARNIIGDGPGSQPVVATTKRAISGSLSPVNVMDPMAASASPMAEPDQTRPGGSVTPSQEEEEEAGGVWGGSTFNPSIVSIIHLVDYTTPSPFSNSATGGSGTGNGSTSDGSSDSQSSVSQTNSVQHQQPNNNNQSTIIRLNNDAEQQQPQQSSGSNTTKVIRIYFPSKLQPSQTSLNSNSSDPQNSSTTNKRPRFDQPDQSSPSLSENSQEPNNHEDTSTAPQNVSMTKVAQGWVINWWPPERPIPEKAPRNPSPQPSHALSQVTTSDVVTIPQSQHQHQQQQQQQQQPSAYSIEYKEKANQSWSPLATSRERSLLLKDLKPGSEYLFRVFALTSSGARGAPSAEFKYLIPDNRRRPGSSEALSAGVVSGILFFIACIVIAVCAVNMCNKRRKKRAGKAAYVMMACPVLESHHDIAALNSNSLMKNSSNPEESRVPGVNTRLDGDGSQLANNIRQAFDLSVSDTQSGSKQAAAEPDVSGRYAMRFGRRSGEVLAHFMRLLQPVWNTNHRTVSGRSGGQDAAGAGSGVPSAAKQSNGRIKFTSNAPLPVDVSPTDQTDGYLGSREMPPKSFNDELDDDRTKVEAAPAEPGNEQPAKSSSQTPIDDYWVRKPSDRKWGTLTLAGSRLAERRAREQAARLHQSGLKDVQQQHHDLNGAIGSSIAPLEGQPPTVGAAATTLADGSNHCRRKQHQGLLAASGEVDSLADEYYAAATRWSSRTLPRSFGASPAMLLGRRCDNNNLQSHHQDQGSQHAQFNSWLHNQIRGPNLVEEQMIQQQHSMLLHPPQVQPRQSRVPPAAPMQLHPFGGPHQHRKSLAPPPPPPHHHHHHHHHQLQPQFHHQRSMSHVEPGTLLANYWLASRSDQMRVAGPQHQPAPSLWTGAFGGQQYDDGHNQRQQHDPFNVAAMFGAGRNLYTQPQPPIYLQQRPPEMEQPIGKRNSLQRRTLPMAGPVAHSAPLLPPASATTTMMMREKFVPNSSIIGQAISAEVNGDAEAPPPPLPPPHQPQPAGSRDDDPVTGTNACLGSYKRKRRLPHIEAQFTITPPELPPPKLHQAQPAKDDHLTAAMRERDALESGHLFVRAIQPPGGGDDNSLMRPRGLPQPGQRSEQRRLRPKSPLDKVETIGPREKIETYLRHYDRVKEEEKRLLAASGIPSAAPTSGKKPEVAQDLISSSCGASPIIQVDQVNELTFQPYHNLPSLKYTINLPLCLAQDGTLLLNETAGHLRHSGSGRRRNNNDQTTSSLNRTSNQPPHLESAPLYHQRQQYGDAPIKCLDGDVGQQGDDFLGLQSRQRPHTMKRKPLGSSSSCPAPPAEFCCPGDAVAKMQALPFDKTSVLSNRKSLACSLESSIANQHQTIGLNANFGACEQAVDSLEGSLNTLGGHNNNNNSDIRNQAPFYLRTPPSPADYSSIRETLMLEVPSPPPPIPPHRTQNAEVQTSPPSEPEHPPGRSPGGQLGEPGRCVSPEPDFGLNGTRGSGTRVMRQHSSEETRESITTTSSTQSPGSSSSSSSNSTQTMSSPSSSSSSSSAGTATENGGDNLTNDHSVDENYEFDQVSSCSSSTRHRRCPVALGPSNASRKFQEHQKRTTRRRRINDLMADQAIYSQVNKTNRKKPEVRRMKRTIESNDGSQEVENNDREAPRIIRSQIYDNSRCKVEELNANSQTSGDGMADHYDIVHEERDTQQPN